MGELVLAYDVKSDNKTSKPWAFYKLYIGPNNGGTGHSLFKLSTMTMIVTPKCKFTHVWQRDCSSKQNGRR